MGTTTVRTVRMKTATLDKNPVVPWTFKIMSKAGRQDMGKRESQSTQAHELENAKFEKLVAEKEFYNFKK